MKRTLTLGAIALLLGTAAASAQNADVVAGSSSDNDVRVNVQSNGSEIPRNTRVTTTGSAIAPGLAAGAIVCAQSTSIAGGFMGGAFAIGSTRQDEDCNGRAWISTMGAMAGATRDGRYIDAARNIACDVSMPGKALRQAGIPCPGDAPRQVARVARVSTKVEAGSTRSFQSSVQRADEATNLQVIQRQSTSRVSGARIVQKQAKAKLEYNHGEARWMERDANGRWKR